MGTKNESPSNERWLPVVGYEGWYDISSLGRVRRIRRGVGTFVGRILKTKIDMKGYCFVGLSVNGETTYHRCHRMVMAAFSGPCPDDKQVNHLDGIKTHNSTDNLEYVTPSENSLHAFRTGLKTVSHGIMLGEENGAAKLCTDDVIEMRKLFGSKPLIAIARQFNISPRQAGRIRDRIKWAWLPDEAAVF